MNFTRITFFKKFVYLFVFSIFITSCEPEELPEEMDKKNNSEQIFSDTGNQKNPPETKG